MFPSKKNSKGFTLVELLVVIAIIGILAVVAVPSLFRNINKANSADIIADLSAIRTSVTSEYADKGYLESGVYINDQIAQRFGIDGLSDKANYNLALDGQTATVTITANNTETAGYVAQNWNLRASTVGEVVTVDLLALPMGSDSSDSYNSGVFE
ncbi:MAG: prepilin-type N-terminal cleavage/methylation domain-containing protein [Peptostreptococcaceae bacterium]